MGRLLHTLLRAPPTPICVWAVGVGTATVVGIEHLFDELEPALLQVQAKVIAYFAAAATAGLTVALVSVFAVSCTGMLRWLDDTVDPRTTGRAIAMAVWAFAVSACTSAALMVGFPPDSLTRQDLVSVARFETDAEAVIGWRWSTETAYLSGVVFLVLVFLLLCRAASRTNAAIAVAFGTTVVLLLRSLLISLAAAHPS